MFARLFAPLSMKIGVGLQLLSLGFIAFLLLAKAAETRRADKLQIRVTETQAALDGTVADYHRVRAEQKAADAEHARKVERAQAQVSEEVSHDYQKALADLRRRYDRFRLQSGRAAADSSGGRGADMPGLSGAASGLDDAAAEARFSLADRLTASEQASQLQALQAWVRIQQQVAH